jgi:hypothetical protein
LHIGFNYVVVGGRRVRKDTKTHQDRYLAIDPVTCAMIREHLDAIRGELAGLGLELPGDAYVFSNDPMGTSPWNPDWATHKASDLAAGAGVKLNIKGLRHYTASCSRPGSTCETPRHTLATAAAEPPRSDTTPTPCLRLTGEPPPISCS